MARVFLRAPDLQWTDHALSSDTMDLGVLLAGALSGLPRSRSAAAVSVLLVPFRAGVAVRWALLAGAGSRVRINGVALAGLGLRVLDHRDEVSLPGVGSAFFSDEELAGTVPLPGSARPIRCGRCLDPIEPGTPAVACPSCRVWHHEREDRRCWTYDVCSCCRRPTKLGQGLQWAPEV
jgi:hypothetical protein